MYPVINTAAMEPNMSSTEGIKPIANMPTPIVIEPTKYPNADVRANSLMLFLFFVNRPMIK